MARDRNGRFPRNQFDASIAMTQAQTSQTRTSKAMGFQCAVLQSKHA